MAERDRVELINESASRKPARVVPAVERPENRRSRRELNLAEDDAETFEMPGERLPPPPKPPLAGPEMDLESSDEGSVSHPADPRSGIDPGLLPRMDPGEVDDRKEGDGGVDDALLPPEPDLRRRNGSTPRAPRGGGEGKDDDDDRDEVDYGVLIPNGVGHMTPFPYAPDFGPTMVNVDGVPTIVPDVNVYQNKKTLAQGMMDLALLSANANQLRYVLESYNRHPYYFVSIFFISVSLVIQIAVGVGLIWNSRYNVKNDEEICKANKVNNLTVLGIFLITVVNVFVAAFGVADPQTDIRA